MTTTERTITPHDVLSVQPEAIIAPDLIHPAPAEAARRGREFAVYKVPSLSEPGDRTVVLNTKDDTIYCDCPSTYPCRHEKSVLFKREYERAYRQYATATEAELRAQDRTLARMAARTLTPVRAFRAIQAAVGDLIRERLDGAA